MYRRVLAALFLLSLLSGFAPIQAQGILLEAEDFFTYGNIPGGYRPIRVVSCSAASGGYGVDGIDVDGEYIKWKLELETSFCFVDSLRSAQTDGETRTFAITFEPEALAGTSASDTLTTLPGRGVT